MDLEFWKKKWISGHTGFHQLSVEPLLENHFLRILKSFEKRFLSNLGGECRIFVPLCGKSVDMLWLKNLEETHPSSLAQNTGVKVTVLGCEISPVASRAFFTENNLRYEEHSSGPFTVFSRCREINLHF